MADTNQQSDGLLALLQLFDPKDISDPYPKFAHLRETNPVWNPAEHVYVVSRQDDAASILRDPNFGHGEPEQLRILRKLRESNGGIKFETAEMPIRSFLGLNPPDHTRLRGLVSRAFTPTRINSLAPQIEKITEDLLDNIPSGTEINLIEKFASPLPVIVISDLLGIPVSDRDQLVSWSHAMARGLDPAFLLPPGVTTRQLQAREEFANYLSGLIAERRKRPGEDLLSALVSVRDSRDVLSEEELIATSILLLVAGHETTTNLLGNGSNALMRHPDQLNLLRQDTALTERAVEEFLRYDSPVQLTARIALENAAINNHKIEKGSMVLILIGAANRDPRTYRNPDQLDITREITRHLAFGQGIHFCLGAPLARLEAQIAFKALLRRFDTITPAGDALWKENTVLRGIAKLPIVAEAAMNRP